MRHCLMLHRVDEIVYFNQLSEDNFKDIAVLMLKELVGTLKEKEINFTWDETLLNYLVKPWCCCQRWWS